MKVYNTNHNFLMLLDSAKFIHTTEQLSTGTKNLEFQVPVNDINLANLIEENYIETSDYNYVIKEIIMENNEFFKVFCIANYEDISGNIFTVFDVFQKSLEQAYSFCLSLTNWNLVYKSQNKTMVTYQTANVSGMEMIRQITEDYNQEVWFDTKNRLLYVYDKMGSPIGTYYSNELKLKQLKKQSNTYEFATVLYPYGKDGLTITNVNHGKNYLTNYEYCDKYIEKVWIDEKYEYAEDLLKAGRLYLEELAQPKASYRLQLATIGNLNLGDEIIIVDKLKRIKQKQRVVKIVRYPNQPELDNVDISNLREDFTETYRKNQRKLMKDIEFIKGVIKDLSNLE